MTRILLILTLFSVTLDAQTVMRLGSAASVGNLVTSGDVVTFGPIGQLGYGSLGVEAAGTWTGTVQIECAASSVGGAYVALTLTPRNSATTVTSFTANGQWSTSIVGCKRVQARATAVMTGTAQITMVGIFE